MNNTAYIAARLAAIILMMAAPAMCGVSRTWAQQTSEALRDQLVGTWKLVSYRSQRAGQQDWRETLGPNPKGHAIITREGRYIHLLLASNRKPPATDLERAALLNSMTAWSGRYTVVAKDEFHILVDTSWAEAHQGERQKQVRFVTIEGDRMTLRTPPQIGARSVTRSETPRRSVTEFVFERER
jgi:hypothetical protein